MSSTKLLRRTATVLTATAIAIPSCAMLGDSAWAAQPASHGNAGHSKAASHTEPPRHGDKSKPAHDTHKAPHHGTKAARHGAAHKPAASNHGTATDNSSRHADATGGQSRGPAKHSDATSHNPRGNNGTVFIHDVAGDNRPHNVPHVGCTFYVDFFGFDSDQVLSTSFVGQAPTGAGTPLPTGDWTGSMPANGASGAGRDFDAEQAFTLDLSALGAPQAQQGYHVKLTVATGEPGGVKHKVFWVSDCAQPTAAAAPAAEHESPAAVGGLRADRPAPVTPQVLGLTVTRTPPAGLTRVMAVSADRTPTALPFTGASVGLLLVLAGAVIAAGGGLLAAGRRRMQLAG